MNLDDLHLADRRHLIHPVSAWGNQEALGPQIFSEGNGAWLSTPDGKNFIDGFSGLWCVNAGYGQKSVVEAARVQLSRLPYATGYFGFSSEPAITLASRLAALAPGDLNRVYFTLGGSDAVDSALRFIRFYQHARGTPQKHHVIGLSRGYHGSSYVGSGLTALSAFHRNADVPLTWQHHIQSPYPYRNPHGTDDASVIASSVAELKSKIAELGSDTIAAFFCEPVQGSGGVIVPPKGWLSAMRKVCQDADILFVADEVITGFGRTGPLFACERENIVPDLMTLAKGLTSGYVPMGAVLMSDNVYETIRDNTPPGVPVGHGMTYSAHPVSAAVGLAVLDLYEGGLIENGKRMGGKLEERLNELSQHPLVGDVRCAGMLAGIELVTDKALKSKPLPTIGLSSHLSRIGMEEGILFRAFPDDIIGLAPPLCCTDDEIDLLVGRLERVLDRALPFVV